MGWGEHISKMQPGAEEYKSEDQGSPQNHPAGPHHGGSNKCAVW